MQNTENSFLSITELEKLPFNRLGENVLISRKASFYNMKEISIGNHVRIDDFCMLSGNIMLGNHIHISAQCLLYGTKGIIMEDFSGLSPGCKIFSLTDDFSGEYLIGPMIAEELTNVEGGLVRIGKYVQIGTACIIMPDLTIGDGTAVGAMSLISKSLDSWSIYAGVPAIFIKDRSQKLIELASQINNK